MNKNDVTKYNKQLSKKKMTIVYIIIYSLIIYMIYLFFKVLKTPISDTGYMQSIFGKIFILCIILFFILILIFSEIGRIKGNLRGKKEIKKEEKLVLNNNPYLYYRELPNNFGIGVATLLFDSEIENNKDVVAIILDLCAKKYIKLTKINDQYLVEILKNIDNNLLKNEKYILELLINHNIKNIDYNLWYKYCLEDGNDLGLYYHADKPKSPSHNEELVKYMEKVRKKKLIISGVLTLIFLFITIISYFSGADSSIFITICVIPMLFIFFFIILSIPYSIATGIKMIKFTNKDSEVQTYEITLNNHLIRTEKGKLEYQKLVSFRDFLSEFGYFKDKNIEEIYLWDRYLSYAQVFGLTKEIMKTGYSKLVDNQSFKIDNIDNINVTDLIIKDN